MTTMTAKEVAARMGIAPITVLRLARAKKLKRIAGRTGVTSTFDARVVERFIKAGLVPRSTKTKRAKAAKAYARHTDGGLYSVGHVCPRCGHLF